MRDFGGRVLTSLLWAGVLVSVLLVGLRWVDSSIAIVAVLQSMVPLVAVGVTGLLVIAVIARRWRVAVVAGAVFSVCATIAVPSVLAHTATSGRDDLVVMSANLQFGRADAPSLVTAVREHRVDVLVLLEVTPAFVERLTGAGLDAVLPESVGVARQGAGGTIIRSRIPMTLVAPGIDDVSPYAFNEPVVSIHRPDGDVVLRAVHARPPVPSGARWRSGLADLRAWRERQPAGQPLVMAGDFNSSLSHPAFRQVAETMTDAHRGAGQGWVRTWPVGSRVPPFVQLDHVLMRGLQVVDAGTVTIAHTDHRAIWARLSPPRH
ncbi:MAG: endonuclease/exonuclease/phosphatase family protein [Phycicoccus sp.]|nr:endonuclease/exonuclease/phosphatase family protein [Phycicoccus sp.]NMM33343.1 endonuclease/exonuclease/phosphatase family protein [Phycicoccus sp.]